MKNNNGFTLVEMLVVIVIIGVLATLAVPKFMGIQERAKISACDYDINAVRQALGLYEIDHHGYAPTTASYINLVDTLVDFNGKPYMTLPPGNNWTNFAYMAPDPYTTYTITCNALDNHKTLRTGTPSGIQ